MGTPFISIALRKETHAVCQPAHLGEDKITNGVVMLKRIKSEFFFKKIIALKVSKSTQNQPEAQLRAAKRRVGSVSSIWTRTGACNVYLSLTAFWAIFNSV